MEQIYSQETQHSIDLRDGFTSPLDLSICKELLLDVKSVLDAHGIEFCLVFGTLLGAYRDNNFIAHDSDIDIGVVGADQAESIRQIIHRGEFAKKGIVSFKERMFTLGRDNHYIDIYPFIKYQDSYKSLLGFTFIDYKITESDMPFSEIDFLGEKFKAPADIEKYLIERYGKDWKTPIVDKHAEC